MRIFKCCEKAVFTLISVNTAFFISEKYALLLNERSESGISAEFFVAQFWNALIKKQCDSATEKSFLFSGFTVVSCFMWHFPVNCSSFRLIFFDFTSLNFSHSG